MNSRFYMRVLMITQFFKYSCFIALICLVSCDKELVAPELLYSYEPPQQLNDGWPVSTLQSTGMDTETIEQVTSQMMDGTFQGIHSFMIVKKGTVVHEVYFEDYTRNSLQTIYSITKSVSSALIGIAIDHGLISTVEDSVFSFFPQYGIQDPAKQGIQLHHLLTLTSGFSWDEKTYPYSDARNSETQMVATDDWMRFVLERPMQSEPGTEWIYNTGSVHLIAGIIKHVYGDYADVFTKRVLFEPLGIDEYEWNKDPKDHPCTGGTLQGLKLKLRDAAKFGYLFLNQGKWNGLQIIPESWAETSTAKHVALESGGEFGYLWWRGHFKIHGRAIQHYYAAGYGGQTIHIVPELDLMIVFTCWDEAQDADIYLPILRIYTAILQGGG